MKLSQEFWFCDRKILSRFKCHFKLWVSDIYKQIKCILNLNECTGRTLLAVTENTALILQGYSGLKMLHSTGM